MNRLYHFIARERHIIFSAAFLFFSIGLQEAEAGKENKKAPKVIRVPIGIAASISPEKGASPGLKMELVARFQQYNPKPNNPADHFDSHISSPKSVIFLSSGKKVYVNSLEGKVTAVYDPKSLTKIGAILHRFGKDDGELFSDSENIEGWDSFPDDGPVRYPNRFWGKPVEFAQTHGGRYLWVSYYRRDFDKKGAMPSAVAVIDTETDKIVRVMRTGPIPKIITPSSDGKWLAVIHWGDNTVGLIDISGDDPSSFNHSELIKVERRFKPKGDKKLSRDHNCGFCLRGAVFTPDSRYLLVGRMRGGGIAVIDMGKKSYVGTVYGMKATPRHLLLSSDGSLLYISSNASGYVSSYRTEDIVDAAISGQKKLKPLNEVRTGPGTRTITLSPDGKFIFAAVNGMSRIVAIDARRMKVLTDIKTDSYPVGMGLSPDGKQLWVTSQGKRGIGGNSVTVYEISEQIAPSAHSRNSP